MSNPTDKASTMLAFTTATFPANGGVVRIAGIGTTEGASGNAASLALTVGKMATLIVGTAAVRVSFRDRHGVSNAVATTAPIVPAGGRFDWVVTTDTVFVYAEAADGSASYECWVWQSSPA